ncbi:hypothetical protein EFB08_16985 [Rufibacter latericius]|uniref:Deoxyribose-phosphate aldolase n=1 Tax=Rufibacter latericius TaxID=2487040 RepID=A0A3M9MF94_9BACT|nr:hypothetical protein EFB08_16985 [Rufibacter latericius]
MTGCEARQSDRQAPSDNGEKDPQAIIDRAIAVHGGTRFLRLHVDFDFRERHYEASRQEGLYTYTRSFTDSTGQVRDVLNNEGFSRTVNGQAKELPPERVKAFSASVNSVIYFALLPFGLNDPSVQKEYLGSAAIHGMPYHKIKVTFRQEGGGTDFQDEFLYFIHQKSFTMDYFAYTYATDGGGIRFRQAMAPRRIEGVLFQDYLNFEPIGPVDFWQIDQAFASGRLKELSRIELENIRVGKP